MVSISTETPDQTSARLRDVIKSARLKVYNRPYCYEEFGPGGFPHAVSSEAVAIVRDDEDWSQLIPHRGGLQERFGLFRFHFEADADNSGFVGWLATRLKQQFGTGVFVVCGQNSRAGGIYDYWGCPFALSEEIFGEVRAMHLGDRADLT